MSQSWMGSDLSNKDISKSTDIIEQYDHRLIETREENGHTAYVIESIPHEDSAVVWGKEILVVRDDYLMQEIEKPDQWTELRTQSSSTHIRSMRSFL
ncbi:MAG: hypothetical protein ACJASY_000297 [Halioglobus sp.]|jgi:hypothetical protein